MSYKLGQKIKIKSFLKRKTKYVDNGNGWHQRTKFWETIELKEEKKVLVIGERTLQNGTTEYDNEIGTMFYPQSYVKALLVVESMSKNPFYIPLPKNQ